MLKCSIFHLIMEYWFIIGTDVKKVSYNIYQMLILHISLELVQTYANQHTIVFKYHMSMLIIERFSSMGDTNSVLVTWKEHAAVCNTGIFEIQIPSTDYHVYK